MCKPNDRFVKRAGKNRVTTSISDIVDCVNSVKWDEVRVKFVAYNAAKIPYFEADSTDLRIIKKNIQDLRIENGNVQKLLHEFECMKTDIVEIKKMHEKQAAQLPNRVD